MEDKGEMILVWQEIGFVYEKDIIKFCSQCDFFIKENHGCRKVFKCNQPRYVLRNWCGAAEVKGEEVKMTKEGFYPRFGKNSS